MKQMAGRKKHSAEDVVRTLRRADELAAALVSDSSNVSPHVHREIERALHRNVVIIPLRIENVLLTRSMEYLLATCQWIDAFDPEFDEALETLTQRIEQLLAAGDSEVSVARCSRYRAEVEPRRDR